MVGLELNYFKNALGFDPCLSVIITLVMWCNNKDNSNDKCNGNTTGFSWEPCVRSYEDGMGIHGLLLPTIMEEVDGKQRLSKALPRPFTAAILLIICDSTCTPLHRAGWCRGIPPKGAVTRSTEIMLPGSRYKLLTLWHHHDITWEAYSQPIGSQLGMWHHHDVTWCLWHHHHHVTDQGL